MVTTQYNEPYRGHIKPERYGNVAECPCSAIKSEFSGLICESMAASDNVNYTLCNIRIGESQVINNRETLCASLDYAPQ